jgi:hypothetical protein
MLPLLERLASGWYALPEVDDQVLVVFNTTRAAAAERFRTLKPRP